MTLACREKLQLRERIDHHSHNLCSKMAVLTQNRVDIVRQQQRDQ